MIGVDANFDFNVASPNPPWLNANEDGILSVHPRRSRIPVLREPEHGEAVANLQQGMLTMEDMGLCDRFGTELCRIMLMRHKNEVIRAVDALMQLAPYSAVSALPGRRLGE
jgi:hypothetical protein